MTFYPLGDRTLLINLQQHIDISINSQVISLAQAIKKANIGGIDYLIPAYCSLTIGYRPDKISYEILKTIIKNLAIQNEVNLTSRLIKIPVCYESPYALDMEEVSQQTGFSRDEIIKLHTSRTYRVFMLGFLPGFPYLGTLAEELKVSRKVNPRLRIPKNSVAIAGLQTGIYSSEAPGGWQVIGRTPLDVFNGQDSNPFLLKAGDEVQFYASRSTTCPVEIAEAFQPVETTQGMPLGASQAGSLCSIIFHKAGLQTTIQDNGRSGYQSFGVPVGGAMDRQAMRTANRLVGNPPNTPVLEMAIMGPKMEFSTTMKTALTGADLSPKVNGMPINLCETITIKKGDVLSFGRLQNGCRGYLAIRGEWQVDRWLDSASAASSDAELLTPNSIIIKGSQLIIKPLTGEEKRIYTPEPISKLLYPLKIHVLPAPEFEQFSRRCIADFFSRSHQLTPDSNRMGYRLKEPLIDFQPPQELISSGVVPGTIQITNSGQPIILMRDAQTTGGYYRFLNVVEADLDVLAQAKPGDEVRFSLVV